MRLCMACDTFALSSTSMSFQLYVFHLSFSNFSFFMLNCPQQIPYTCNIHCHWQIIEFIHYNYASFKSHIDCKAGPHLRRSRLYFPHQDDTNYVFYTLSLLSKAGRCAHLYWFHLKCLFKGCMLLLSFFSFVEEHQGHRKQSLRVH